MYNEYFHNTIRSKQSENKKSKTHVLHLRKGKTDAVSALEASNVSRCCVGPVPGSICDMSLDSLQAK